MKEKLQDLIADALYPTSSNDLPSECARLGLAPGQPSEAFSGKRKYVTKRLDNLSAAEMIDIAKRVVNEHPSDELQTAIERLDDSAGLVSSITRHKLAEALDKFTLSGKYSLIEMLAKHWPSFRQSVHLNDLGKSLGFLGISDFIDSSNPDLDQANSEILKQVGFFNCSQSRLFEFLEDIVDPSRRDYVDQQRIVNQLNPILERDAYSFIHDDDVSGYPLFHVCKRLDSNTHPGRESISRRLIQYDEFGVYDAWQKALDRKDKDPKGAITAAKSLLETVCKQIIEEAGSKYSDRDDLP
ncbi:MAG: hypothetical protein F4Y47_16660, partial [Acidobacteriia bacterium]|nr:hypothetical protein [Terriglobia bacterium]